MSGAYTTRPPLKQQSRARQPYTHTHLSASSPAASRARRPLQSKRGRSGIKKREVRNAVRKSHGTVPHTQGARDQERVGAPEVHARDDNLAGHADVHRRRRAFLPSLSLTLPSLSESTLAASLALGMSCALSSMYSWYSFWSHAHNCCRCRSWAHESTMDLRNEMTMYAQ